MEFGSAGKVAKALLNISEECKSLGVDLGNQYCCVCPNCDRGTELQVTATVEVLLTDIHDGIMMP